MLDLALNLGLKAFYMK